MSSFPSYDYYSSQLVDASFGSSGANGFMAFTGDLNRDGKADLVILGMDFPSNANDPRAWNPQPGRLLLGDGKGKFTVAPADLFPVDRLLTVTPRDVVIADFNGDGQNDLFVADHGWDANPFPGFQNQLFLSTPAGGWRYATDQLPQISDFTHAAAAADIDRDGDLDILAGNGFGPIPPFFLINDGTGRFTRDDTLLPNARGEILDTVTRVTHFNGAEFADLDRDGWSDLILTGNTAMTSDQFRQTTIFWNQQGKFVESQTTALPEPSRKGPRLDMEVGIADFDGDGVKDIILVGTSGTGDGSFVQMFRGLEGRRYEDVSASHLLPQSARDIMPTDSTPLNKPWPRWIKVADYNGDLAPDFWIEFSGAIPGPTAPVLWLNDGQGKFTAVTAGQLVDSPWESQFAFGPLFQTSGGLQFVGPALERSGRLLLNGATTTKPYIGRTGDEGAETLTGNANRNYFVGGGGNDIIDGAGGIDFATYQLKSRDYQMQATAVGTLEIRAASGDEGTDILRNIERLKFSDGMVAVDLAGNAGTVARLVGTLFGKASVANPKIIGIGLSLLDTGMTPLELAAKAIGTSDFSRLAGGTSNAQFVELVYSNVVGVAPPAQARELYVAMLDRGESSKAALALFAANTATIEQKIDLVGLAARGLPFESYDF